MISLSRLMLACLYVLPLIGLAIVLMVRRSDSQRSLAPAILLAAVITSLLATCFGIFSSTMPIRPYETEAFPGLTLLKSILLFLYVGFGIGAVLASLLLVPASFAIKRFSRRSEKSEPPPGDNQENLIA
jgi:glucan phosphoethanolaminetransferase (alkaline phosphatase superfamily)